MATIALTGNTIGCSLGIGSFESLGKAFLNSKNSTGGLSGALSSLKNKIDIASITAVALSFVELVTQIAKVGLKNFLTGGEKGLLNIAKYHLKNLANGIKADFKSIFGKGLFHIEKNIVGAINPS